MRRSVTVKAIGLLGAGRRGRRASSSASGCPTATSCARCWTAWEVVIPASSRSTSRTPAARRPDRGAHDPGRGAARLRSGLAAVLVAAVLGSTASFVIRRSLGRDAVRGVSNERVRALDERVADHGFATVLLARLVPLVPFSTANYAFGLTSVTARVVRPATALGILPGTAVYVAVGAYGTSPARCPSCWRSSGWCCSGVVGCCAVPAQQATDARDVTTDDAAVPAQR